MLFYSAYLQFLNKQKELWWYLFSLGTPMENEVLWIVRHSWQMLYVTPPHPHNPQKIHMVHNISQMKSKASQGRSLGGFWSQIARNKCAILILALKLPLLEWSQSHNLCSTAHLKVETRCFLVCFSSGKKKKIRTLDEICNPSYTNLRSPRRFYNLIPKQAAKRGNSPGEKKDFLFFPSSSFVWISETFSWASHCSHGFCPFLFPSLRGCPHCGGGPGAAAHTGPGKVHLLPMMLLSVTKAVRGDTEGPHAATDNLSIFIITSCVAAPLEWGVSVASN